MVHHACLCQWRATPCHTSDAGIPKLDDANDAGGRNSHNCTLILTEGDSAKALAMSGLSVVGRDNYGVFPLRYAMAAGCWPSVLLLADRGGIPWWHEPMHTSIALPEVASSQLFRVAVGIKLRCAHCRPACQPQ
jgi:hypothetical protein